MNKSLLKTIHQEINNYILGLSDEERLDKIISYIIKNPIALLEPNEISSKRVNYMIYEREYGNNYGSSMEYSIYKENVTEYETLLKTFVESPELKNQTIKLLSHLPILTSIIENIEYNEKQKNNEEYNSISYSKFKMLEKLESSRDSGEIEVAKIYLSQHAIQFVLNNYKSFKDDILESILNREFQTEKQLLNYLNLSNIQDIKKFPKPIVNILKENNSWLNTKGLKIK